MHEPFLPTCGYCAKFTYCFRPQGWLADWGYCLHEWNGATPTTEQLAALEEAAATGDYQRLLTLAKGFYQVSDDGCSRYQPAHAPLSH